jgi:hypothetical protein
VVLTLTGSVGAQTPNDEVMAPIKKFIDTFNKGDMPGAASTHAKTADLTIMDEVPPFHWTGADAFTAWSAALEKDAKKRGVTEPIVTLSPATRFEIDGDQAYVVAPAVYTYKENGVAMRESAEMTFTLKKASGSWLIHSWAWSGSKPKKAGTPKS